MRGKYFSQIIFSLNLELFTQGNVKYKVQVNGKVTANPEARLTLHVL